MNERDWINATHNSYGDNPTERDGPEQDNCRLCDMEPKYEDMDVCEGCYDDLEEGREYSYCCTAILTEGGICISCLDHASSATEEALEGTDICIKDYRYKPNNNNNTQKPFEEMSMLD